MTVLVDSDHNHTATAKVCVDLAWLELIEEPPGPCVQPTDDPAPLEHLAHVSPLVARGELPTGQLLDLLGREEALLVLGVPLGRQCIQDDIRTARFLNLVVQLHVLLLKRAAEFLVHRVRAPPVDDLAHAIMRSNLQHIRN